MHQIDKMRTSLLLDCVTRKWQRVLIPLLLADRKNPFSSLNSQWIVNSHGNPEVSRSVQGQQLRS
jgi:hypothetical protein